MAKRIKEKFRKESESVDLIINNETVKPGESALVRLKVGRLPSGTKITIDSHIFRAEKEGPTVLIVGGIHGDEINGVEIIRECLEDEIFEKLLRGTVIAIPILNIYGFINFSREVPKGKDVNRSFPGSTRGSLASRVARALTKKVLPYADIILDLHTGGASRFNVPQIRYTKSDELALEIAKKFGVSFIIEKPIISRSLRKITHDLGKPTLVYEGGESKRFDGYSIHMGVQGIKNVLYALDMLPNLSPQFSKEQWHIKKSSWIRASHAGLFLWNKCAGQKVVKGEPLGEIKDPQGLQSVTVIANRDGYIIGHNNASVINQGDALFHIAYQYEKLP